MNSPYTMDSYSNKTGWSYLLHCDQTFFASSIQPIVAQSLPFDMLVAVCFGQGLTAKLRTSARTALLVHNMHANILENHLSHTQFPHFPGNWSLRICLPSMGQPIWSPWTITVTSTNWIDYPQSSPRRSYKRPNSTSAVIEYLIHSLLIMEHNLLLRHSRHLQRSTSSSTSLPLLIGPSLMAEPKQR